MSSDRSSNTPSIAEKIEPARKRLNVIWVVVLFLSAGCWLIPLTLGLIYGVSYHSWIVIQAPHPKRADLPVPRPLSYDLPDGTYDFSWYRDGSALLVRGYDRRHGLDSPGYIALTINAGSGEIVETRRYNDQFTIGEEYGDLVQLSPTEQDEALWGQCPSQELRIRGMQIDGNAWELILEQRGVVIDRFRLQSHQWRDTRSPPTPGPYAFSADCKKFLVRLSGWIYYEGDGREELWLLDIPSRKLVKVLSGRWGIFRLWDYPVQAVSPSWSPDGIEIVFGDENFELEIFNTDTQRRRWLAPPGLIGISGYFPVWSPSGKWIAVLHTLDYQESIIILSRDGLSYASSDSCSSIMDKVWAPNHDQLVYASRDKTGSRSDLWIWNLDE